MTYDKAYLSRLAGDMAKGESDACAAFYAATYREAVRTSSRMLGDEYAVQDVLEALYTDIFSHRKLPRSGRVFLNIFRSKLKNLCAEKLAKAPRKGGKIPLARGRGVNSEETAELLLNYILRRTGHRPCRVPLSTFFAYNEYRVSRTTFQRALIVLALALLAAIPLVFQKPTLTLSEERENAWAPTYTLAYSAFFPADSVKAELNGESIPVTRQVDDSYVIEPTEEGLLKISVTLITKADSSIETVVTQVDLTKPEVVSSTADARNLTVTLTDSGSGLDLEHAYAIQPDGTESTPESWDDEEGVVVFERLDDNSNLYIPDIAGNVLHIICQYGT